MSLPLGMTWEIEPVAWRADGMTVTAQAGPSTDYFIDPAGAHRALNAPRALVLPPRGPWQLAARVRVGFAGTYDAGVLMVFADDEHWAKLCFERSPQGSAMVVSVVTNGRSDDANAWVVTEPDIEDSEVWLRVSKVGEAYAFHASADGLKWDFVRYFGLGSDIPHRVGIVVQAPVGKGCSATFFDLSLTAGQLADMRDGS